jgi:hypothetical protein
VAPISTCWILETGQTWSSIRRRYFESLFPRTEG